MDMPLSSNSPYLLHLACLQKDEIAVRSILKDTDHSEEHLYKEDLSHGWIPMLWAAHAGSVECMRVMAECGVSTAYASVRLHQTALHVAADATNYAAVRWLIDSSPATPINTKDYLGETALHKAARRGDAVTLELLYSCGADFSLHNNTGLTAIELAKQCGHESLADQMRSVLEAKPPGPLPQKLSTALNPRKRSYVEVDCGGEDLKRFRSVVKG